MTNNPHSYLRSTLACAGLVLALLFVTGCANYRLGQPAELPFTTLYVPPVKNRSMAPQVQALLSQQIIAKLQEQQAIKIVDSPSADATLQVIVTDYERNVAATQQSDTYLAESFGLTLDATVILTDNRTDKAFIPAREVSATQQAFVTGGFQPSEYEAMPVLTAKLADKIVNMVTSTW